MIAVMNKQLPELAILVRNLRQERTLTQVELARLTGLNSNTISNIERGSVTFISMITLSRLEKVLRGKGRLRNAYYKFVHGMDGLD